MKLEIKNVSKKFKNNEVITNVNITLESGHIYGFRGRNGSGKSVLLKMMCDLLHPTTGEILIDGKNIHNCAFTYNVGALIEHPSFFSNMSGYQNLKVLAELRKKIGEKEIMDALEVVNLVSEKDKKYGKYSLGMKQKLGIAQAIMEDQKIILLDEAFSGIEEASVKQIKEYLKEEKKKDKIIVVSSHIAEDLDELCDTIFYFQNGKVTELSNEKKL